MIKDFEPRLYQQTILATAADRNTLVVLPTGLGKTYIFLLLAALRLQKQPGTKILLMGPTRPLISQYHEVFTKHLEIDPARMNIFTGMVSPEKREQLWKNSDIIFSTPQGLENDVISRKIDLSNVSLLGFDEAHRAVGDYSYVWLAQQYMKTAKHSRILAMTASPGSDLEKINEVVKNLHIEAVEIRTDSDPDVKPYIQETNVKWIYVELPQHFKQIQTYLNECFKSKTKQIVLEKPSPLENRRELLGLQAEIIGELSRGNRDPVIMKNLSLLAEALKVQHAIEMLETQGVQPLLDYMEGIVQQSKTSRVRAVQNLVQDLNFKSALILTRNLKDMNLQHPKYAELKKILSEMKGKRVIVFSQYRDSITALLEEVRKIGLKAEMFVGQQKKKGTGLSQKNQIAMIERFRNGEFDVLIMSSVGEEGLDIPSVDTVIFYEPVPSAIRTIQRRGRTGRQDKGEVIVLVTKGTRDETYRWSSHFKERRMTTILNDLRGKFNTVSQKTVTEFTVPDTGLTVYADYREKGSQIIKKLMDLGININLQNLEIGDYLLSNELVVEHKAIGDFIDSILDKRLFSQMKSMKKYPKQLIILEGEEDIYAQRKLHPNAIRGMMATITLNYGIPILQAKNGYESALLLAVIAKRMQTPKDDDFTMHSSKPLTLKEQQEYIVSALPGIGGTISKPLLKKFGSVRNIINATENELKEVDLIGDKKAAKIREIIDSIYEDKE